MRILAMLGLWLSMVPASAGSLNIDYDITLLGLPLGDADLKAQFENGRYDLRLDVKMTGLVGMVTGGQGAGTAAGQFGAGRILPTTFAVSSRNSSSQRLVRMTLPQGNVSAVEIDPPIDVRPDRVPVLPEHRRGVSDPLSALLMPVVSKSNVLSPDNCNRTIPVFDGASRFDVILSHAGTRRVKKPGFEGDVLICNARYTPISGHRAKRASVKFMAENRDMQVWLAPLGGPQLLMPLRISVRTMIGTSVIEASRIVSDADVTAGTWAKAR